MDGNLIDARTHTAETIAIDEGELMLGEEQDGVRDAFDSNQSLDEWIDEVCIMSRTVTAKEVKVMYKSSSCLVLAVHVRNTGGTTLKITDAYLEAAGVHEHITRNEMLFSGDGILEKGEFEAVYFSYQTPLKRSKLYTITIVSERGVQALYGVLELGKVEQVYISPIEFSLETRQRYTGDIVCNGGIISSFKVYA